MIASKLLVSTVTAISVVGAIGMAYAQSTTTPTTPPDAITVTPGSPSAAAVESATPVPMPTSPAMQGAPSTLPEEPLARADRN